MRTTLTLALLLLPTFGSAQSITYDDGPWITIPAGVTPPAMMSPQEEILAMADLDGNPDIITPREAEMITVLAQILGTTPISP